MLRILLFLATNLAVMVVASISLSLLGVTTALAKNGVDLDLQSLLIICAVIGMTGSLISLLLSKPIAKWTTGAKVVKQARSEDERWLIDTVKRLAAKSDIGMPDVAIFDSHQANAFATGWNKNKALVAVSSGLLTRFDRKETEAVLAHEIAHVANGDMITLTLIQGVVNTFVMFFARIIGHVVDRTVFKTESGRGTGYYIVTIVAEIVLGILASMIVCAFSRWREFRADAGGARLAGTSAMIGALTRLKQEYDEPSELPQAMQAFGLKNHRRGGLMSLFATHPPLEKRIAVLRGGA